MSTAAKLMTPAGMMSSGDAFAESVEPPGAGAAGANPGGPGTAPGAFGIVAVGPGAGTGFGTDACGAGTGLFGTARRIAGGLGPGGLPGWAMRLVGVAAASPATDPDPGSTEPGASAAPALATGCDGVDV